jgi:hypothetical protein
MSRVLRGVLAVALIVVAIGAYWGLRDSGGEPSGRTLGAKATPTSLPATPRDEWVTGLSTVCVTLGDTALGVDRAAISEAAARVVESLGMDAAAGGTCDGTLSLDLTFTPLYEHYIGIMGPSADCYTGASLKGEIALAAEGKSPISVPVERIDEPSRGVQITTCPGPTEAPFDGIWPSAILEGLVSIWGERVLFDAVADADPGLRRAAVGMLTRSASPDAVPAIIAALKDREPDVRAAAASMLGVVNPGPEGVVDALIEALADNSSQVPSSAVGSLGALGPAAAPALPELLKLARSGEDYQRTQVVQTIGQIGPDAASAIPELTKLLSDPSEGLCRAAAEALGGIGPAAMDTVPALIELLDSEEWTIAHAALGALEGITGQPLGKSPEPWRQWWDGRK